MRLLLTCLLAAALSGAANAQPTCTEAGKRFCTKLMLGQGVCDGKDQVPFMQRAWEPVPIRILGVTVGFSLSSRLLHWQRVFRISSETGYAHAGNSAHPDIMASQVGPGTNTVFFPAGNVFTFPARVDEHTHIDVHVGCMPGFRYQAWVLVYYELDSKPH